MKILYNESELYTGDEQPEWDDFERYWESFLDTVNTEVIPKLVRADALPNLVLCESEGLGWRKRPGAKIIRVDEGHARRLVHSLLPDTNEWTMEIEPLPYKRFAVVVHHHDGSDHLKLRPLTKREIQRGWTETVIGKLYTEDRA